MVKRVMVKANVCLIWCVKYRRAARLFWRLSACRGLDADVLAEGVGRCHHLYNKSCLYISRTRSSCGKKQEKLFHRRRSLPLFAPVSDRGLFFLFITIDFKMIFTFTFCDSVQAFFKIFPHHKRQPILRVSLKYRTVRLHKHCKIKHALASRALNIKTIPAAGPGSSGSPPFCHF